MYVMPTVYIAYMKSRACIFDSICVELFCVAADKLGVPRPVS